MKSDELTVVVPLSFCFVRFEFGPTYFVYVLCSHLLFDEISCGDKWPSSNNLQKLEQSIVYACINYHLGGRGRAEARYNVDSDPQRDSRKSVIGQL